MSGRCRCGLQANHPLRGDRHDLQRLDLVGVVDVAVSYCLAFATAFRARHVRYERAGLVLRLVLKRLIRRPHGFVWPPRAAAVVGA